MTAGPAGPKSRAQDAAVLRATARQLNIYAQTLVVAVAVAQLGEAWSACVRNATFDGRNGATARAYAARRFHNYENWRFGATMCYVQAALPLNMLSRDAACRSPSASRLPHARVEVCVHTRPRSTPQSCSPAGCAVERRCRNARASRIARTRKRGAEFSQRGRPREETNANVVSELERVRLVSQDESFYVRRCSGPIFAGVREVPLNCVVRPRARGP